MRTPVMMAIAAMLSGACMAPPAPSDPTAPSTTGQALAQIHCPHRIAEANAWVNFMPGPTRAARTLNVDVRLVESTDTAIILKSAATTGDQLVLEIRTSPAAPIPGRLAFREPVPDPMYKRISFFCRGGEIHAIDRIEKVY